MADEVQNSSPSNSGGEARTLSFDAACQEWLPPPAVMIELYDQLIINNGVLPIKWKPPYGKRSLEESPPSGPDVTSFQEPTQPAKQEEERRDPAKFLIDDFEIEESTTAPRLGLQRKPSQVKKKVASFDSILTSMLKNKDELISNK